MRLRKQVLSILLAGILAFTSMGTGSVLAMETSGEASGLEDNRSEIDIVQMDSKADDLGLSNSESLVDADASDSLLSDEEATVEQGNPQKTEVKESRDETGGVGSTESSAEYTEEDIPTADQPQTEEDFEDGDPGRMRLAGNIPEGFYDGEGELQTMATVPTLGEYVAEKGVDISKWNGTVDWKKAAASGIKFTIIRVCARTTGDGSLFLDEKAETNLKGALAAGLDVGVYIFSQAKTENEAEEEAKYLVDQTNTILGPLGKTVQDLNGPFVFDYEYYPGGRFTKASSGTNSNRTKCALKALNYFKSKGLDGMLYANKSMLTNDMDAATISKSFKVWLAHYTSSMTNYTGTFDYWQYTSTAKVDWATGNSGNVDMNYRYVRSVDVVNTTLNSVTLKWSKIVNASRYEIYRKLYTDTDFPTAPLTTTTALSYTDTGLDKETGYTYKIRPLASDGVTEIKVIEAGRDPSTGATLNAVTACTMHEGTTTCSAKSAGFDMIEVSWAAAPNAASYVIQKWMGSSWGYLGTVAASTTGFTDGYNLNQTDYRYRVIYNKNIPGGVSNGANASPETIGRATGKVTGKTKVKNLKVTKTAATSGTKTVKTISKKNTSVTVTGRTGKYYRITVKISKKNYTGFVPVSKITLTVGKPTLKVSKSGSKKVKLTWKKTKNAVGYQIVRLSPGSGKYKTVAFVNTPGYLDINLKGGKTYKYKVRAYVITSGTKVYSSYSSVKSIKPKK